MLFAHAMGALRWLRAASSDKPTRLPQELEFVRCASPVADWLRFMTDSGGVDGAATARFAGGGDELSGALLFLLVDDAPACSYAVMAAIRLYPE